MFNKKFKKCMKILDDEIRFEEEMYKIYLDKDYSHIKYPTVRDELIMFNLEKMNEHLGRLQALKDLKLRLRDEIGV